MNDTKTIKKFLKPTIGSLAFSVFVVVFFGAILIGAIIATIIDKDATYSMLVAFLIFAGIIYVKAKDIVKDVKRIRVCNVQIEELNRNGVLPLVLEEFKNADLLCKDTLRLSDHFLFGKQSGIVLEYRNINRVFQSVHDDHVNKERRELHFITTTGETVVLDKLKLRSYVEANEIMSRIYMRNNKIKIEFNE